MFLSKGEKGHSSSIITGGRLTGTPRNSYSGGKERKCDLDKRATGTVQKSSVASRREKSKRKKATQEKKEGTNGRLVSLRSTGGILGKRRKRKSGRETR